MSQHNVRVSFAQMLDHAELVQDIGEGVTGADLERETVLGLAVVRALELIGESANRVPRDVQEGLPELPWRELIGLRNVLVHQYDALNYDVIAAIIRDEIPTLVEQLRAIIETKDL